MNTHSKQPLLRYAHYTNSTAPCHAIEKKDILFGCRQCRKHNNEFRAHLQFRDESDKKAQIRGPSRATEEEAQVDLEQIRKAGAVGKDREEGLEIMAAEAQKDQNHGAISISNTGDLTTTYLNGNSRGKRLQGRRHI